MYRDDREALHHQAESATREADRLRRENEAMRLAVSRQAAPQVSTMAMQPGAVYTMLDLRSLPMEERARLAMHSVKRFPVWLVGILNVVTFGLFPLIHFGLLHDRLPRAAHNDPGAGKAIGFSFIPYFGFYWVFFNALRLADRLSLQFRLRGLPDRAPKGLLIAACVLTVIPYVNFAIGIPILWTIAVCVLQSKVNRVASLGPTTWDAATLDAPSAPNAHGELGALPPLLTASMGSAGYPMIPCSPEQLAQQGRAQKLVNWSHVLGWGGLGTLVVGGGVAGVVGGAAAAGVVAGVAGISAVVGAVIGQVGRGMQGRAL